MQNKSQINIMSALDTNCKIYPEYAWLHDKIKRHFDSTSSSIHYLHSGSTEKDKDSDSSSSSSKRMFKKISISSISCVTKENQSFTMPVSSR